MNAPTDRIAPVQGFAQGIPWWLHVEAHNEYAKRYSGQSAERIAERGGFGIEELDKFIPGWRDKVSEVGKLRTALLNLYNAVQLDTDPQKDGPLDLAMHVAKDLLR